jgi:hypothetical protein
MAKGVLINFKVDGDHKQADFPRTVFSGTTEDNITSPTGCVNITGDTCNITGLSDALQEVYIKITCEGCTDKVFRVDLKGGTP